MVNTFFSQDANGKVHLWLRKSSAQSDAKLSYFKRKVLEALKASEEREKKEVRKALIDMESAVIEKAGYPIGTIREWKGRKFIKIAQGKWRPKYDSNTRGAKLAVKAIMRKVNACTSSEELLQIVLANKARFTDAVGGPLDIVRELSDYVNKKNDELEGKVVAAEKKQAAKRTQRKPHVDSDVLDLCKKNSSDYKYGRERAKNIIKGKSDKQIRSKIRDWKDIITYEQNHLKGASPTKVEERRYNIVVCQAAIDYAREYLAKRQGVNSAKNTPATKSQIKAFVQDAIDNGSVNKELFLDNITSDAHKRILDKTGIDAKGIIIDSSATRHAINKQEHHLEIDDFTKIADIVNSTDNIEVQEKKHSDNTVIMFTEDKNNGMKLCMEFRSKKGNLALVTAYYQKKPHGNDGKAPEQTSETTRGAWRDNNNVPPTSTPILPPSSEKSSGIDALREKYSASPSVTGDEDEIYLAGNGGTVQGKWKLVEADAPSASHDEQTFNKTKGFPTADNGGTVNDRDYEHDRAAKENVMTVASNYDGRAVGMDEPVVVTEDGIVISGNNRTMSSKLAARNGTDKKYIDALTKKAKRFGFSANDVGKFKHPRVVFEVAAPDKYTTELFAQFNKSDKKAMSPVEAAVKVCKTMKSETVESIAGKIAEFDTLGEMYADSRTMTGIFDSLIAGGTITKTDLPMYFADGSVTGAGKEFLETVLIGSVINENNIRQMGSEGGKAIRQKLVRAILPLVENKSMDGYSINSEMNDAVQIALAVAKDRKTFKTIDNFLDQSDMFNSKPDPVTVAFAKKLDGGTQKGFAQFMLDMNCGLRTAADGQADIFAVGVESKDTIINRVLGIKKAVSDWLARLAA